MDASGWIVLVLLAVIGALAVALLLLRRGGGVGNDGVGSDVAGRVAQLADAQARMADQVAARLQAQERALAEVLQRSGDRTAATLTEVRERLAVIDRAQATITELSGQVVALQEVLGNKQARGAFGEVQLHDLVTACLPPSAYGFQVTLGNGRRADCLIRLPQPPGPICIDAKFPLESWHALRDAHAGGDEAARVQAGRAFAAAVGKHVKDIAERYLVPGETADSALMFLPSEAIYAELHARFPQVVEASWRAKVWIVSPTTLMATLNTVRAVLKDARMQEQAALIQAEVRALMDDLGRLDDRVGKLARHFDQAVEDVRQIRTSTDRLTRRGDRIQRLEFGEDEAAAE
ncbi:DNA recombination protein RmuC [Caenispirillum bisanense]|uniref:DNA recombination protein RmuC n=1 Tax=Caenispirillum bisanense TaxID=414052 RepID=UPI0031D4B4E5